MKRKSEEQCHTCFQKKCLYAESRLVTIHTQANNTAQQYMQYIVIQKNSIYNIRRIPERKAHCQAKHHQASNFTPLKNYIGMER